MRKIALSLSLILASLSFQALATCGSPPAPACTATMTPVPTPPVRLDLQVSNATTGAARSAIHFRITNYSTADYDSAHNGSLRVQVRTDGSAAGGLTVDGPATLNAYTVAGVLAGSYAVTYSKTDINPDLICSASRKNRKHLTATINTVLIPANGGYLTGTGGFEMEWGDSTASYDSSNDFTKASDAGSPGGPLVDSPYFNLLANYGLMCEWKDPSTTDPQKGYAGCGPGGGICF